ncbi:fumarylacetoacetate hydrolase family protein [Nocardiopsis potens]|uniref:fumarylacetoacetate hydrolase family protein n=1 Tax=Nocardiopsis potens TaxID=1246458 RepID=UPI00034597A2|nr:fumarylacetoacetate hydrolase family protein [Nocardiopsis potens]
MKFLRIGAPGAERPAVLSADGTPLDISGITPDVDGAFLSGDGPDRVRAALAGGALPPLEGAAGAGREGGPRVGPPVAPDGKLIGIGTNYSDYAAATGAEPPERPIVFIKPTDTVVGPYDRVLIPRGCSATDHEVELAVVIGRHARYLASEKEAAAAVAGFTIANDVTEREHQFGHGGQWGKGKSFETFTPLGPWLVTPDELDGGGAAPLGLRLRVNGSLVQEGSTGAMLFGVAYLVHHLSHFMALRPGDVIITGTPAGPAMTRPGTPYLREGDVMELEIDGLGTQRQLLAAA